MNEQWANVLVTSGGLAGVITILWKVFTKFITPVLNAKEAQNNAYADQIKDLSEENKQLRADARERETHWRKVIDDLHKGYEVKIDKLEEEIENLRKDYSELMDEIAEVRRENAALQKMLLSVRITDKDKE